MAEFSNLSLSDNPLPPTQLLVRGKDSIQVIAGPPSTSKPPTSSSDNDTNLIELRFIDMFIDIKNLKICPIYSPDGSILCFTYEGNRNITLHDPVTGRQIAELPISNAEKVSFSPLGAIVIYGCPK